MKSNDGFFKKVLRIIEARELHRIVLGNVVNKIGMYMSLISTCSHRGSCFNQPINQLTHQSKTILNTYMYHI